MKVKSKEEIMLQLRPLLDAHYALSDKEEADVDWLSPEKDRKRREKYKAQVGKIEAKMDKIIFKLTEQEYNSLPETIATTETWEELVERKGKEKGE